MSRIASPTWVFTYFGGRGGPGMNAEVSPFETDGDKNRVPRGGEENIVETVKLLKISWT